MSTLQQTIEAIYRIESAKLIAGLTRLTRDVGIAEDLAQNALVAALEQWPGSGVPEKPGAWLMATAKRRGIDHLRHRKMAGDKHHALGQEADAMNTTPDIESAIDDDVGDDLLRLVFISCHPVLSSESQVALTLRLLGGLSTDEIARAFLTTEATVGQRIVRAKRTLAEKQIPFELPRREERAARIGAVLAVIYLIFNEGYSATSGDDWVRPELCEDALRLGRILAGLVPNDAEPLGLTALMSLQASRMKARVNADGSPVLLADQNRARWDGVLIEHGLRALARAVELGGGPYTLQAAIAACHARARTADATDWQRIAELYGELAAASPSPVIELNRAVAIGMAFGPEKGLEHLETIDGLDNYHFLPTVRADFLAKLGRNAEAVKELRRAAQLTQNERERILLTERAERLAGD